MSGVSKIAAAARGSDEVALLLADCPIHERAEPSDGSTSTKICVVSSNTQWLAAAG